MDDPLVVLRGLVTVTWALVVGTFLLEAAAVLPVARGMGLPSGAVVLTECGKRARRYIPILGALTAGGLLVLVFTDDMRGADLALTVAAALLGVMQILVTVTVYLAFDRRAHAASAAGDDELFRRSTTRLLRAHVLRTVEALAGVTLLLITVLR